MRAEQRKLIFDAAKVLGARFVTAADVAVMDTAINLAVALDKPQPPVAPPAPVAKRTGFILGERSLKVLEGVHPTLAKVVKLAITLTPQDFTALQGIRSLADQKKAVAAGNSRTMKSKHLPDETGKARAVDLAAWVNGKVSWEFNRYAAIAWAMDQAATQLGVANHIRWGCAWDRVLSDFGGDVRAYLAEAEAYAKRHPGKDLIDGPHFEWVA